MKLNFTLLLFFTVCTATSFAQLAGDYRSAAGGLGVWSTPSVWQVYNGTTWEAATSAPTALNGTITISAGDSITLTDSRAIDQVIVTNGGILSIFNLDVPDLADPVEFTLADGPGDDLTVYSGGRLYVSRKANLLGTGNIAVNSGAFMAARRTGILAVPTTIGSNAELRIERLLTVRNTLTNNGFITWDSSNIVLENGHLINNGHLNILGGDGGFITNDVGTNSVVNNATAFITRFHAAGATTIEAPFTNSGTIRGIGFFNPQNVTNTGSVRPGDLPGGDPMGTLALSPQTVASGGALWFGIINGSGAGTGNDLITFANGANLSNVNLVVAENSAAPVQTYTIMTTTAGTFTGNFASVVLPGGYTLDYTPGGTTVNVIKTGPTLPVRWGEFTGQARNRAILLQWSTLQESNSSHFIVEHSRDGQNFNAIGRVAASGNSESRRVYTFTHASPDAGRNNLYRLRQVDLDGKASFSGILNVSPGRQQSSAVLARPNPVREGLELSVQGEDISVTIHDANGRALRNLKLQPGIHPVDVNGLPAGLYHLVIYQKGKRIEAQRLIKL